MWHSSTTTFNEPQFAAEGVSDKVSRALLERSEHLAIILRGVRVVVWNRNLSSASAPGLVSAQTWYRLAGAQQRTDASGGGQCWEGAIDIGTRVSPSSAHESLSHGACAPLGNSRACPRVHHLPGSNALLAIVLWTRASV